MDVSGRVTWTVWYLGLCAYKTFVITCSPVQLTAAPSDGTASAMLVREALSQTTSAGTSSLRHQMALLTHAHLFLLFGFETKASWLHVEATDALKNASPVPDGLLTGRNTCSTGVCRDTPLPQNKTCTARTLTSKTPERAECDL